MFGISVEGIRGFICLIGHGLPCFTSRPPNSETINLLTSCFEIRQNILYGNVWSCNYLWVKLQAVCSAAALIQCPVHRAVTLALEQQDQPWQPCGLVDDEWINNACETPEPQEVKCLLVQEFVDSKKCCIQRGVNERKSIDCNKAQTLWWPSDKKTLTSCLLNKQQQSKAVRKQVRSEITKKEVEERVVQAFIGLKQVFSRASSSVRLHLALSAKC